MQGVFSAPRIVTGPGAIEALSGFGARRPLAGHPGVGRGNRICGRLAGSTST